MIAFFSEGVPPAAVYFVCPWLIAAIGACLMNCGVSKSGSPAPSPMMSLPSDLRRAALAVTARVGEGLMALRRSATSDMEAPEAVGVGVRYSHFNLLDLFVWLFTSRLRHLSYRPLMEVITHPGSPFRLHQSFAPAGDQPQAIDKLVEGLNDGLSYQTLLGVTGSGKTYTMAHVIARIGRPALIIAPNKTLAAQLYSEMREFFPENAVEYFVSYYDYYQPEAYVPSRDLYIEKDSSINEHIEQMRLSATKSMLERPDAIIVATVSCIYGIGDPSDYHSMILHLRENEKIAQREAIKRLTEMQYERNDVEFKRGTFRVRGDVIDIFPAENSETSIRVSLFDDEVENLSVFDPLTGHILQRVSRFTVYPSSHYVTPRATTLRAIEAIKAQLRERIEYFQRENRLVECQRIEQRTRFDLEMMSEMGFCKGIENYSRHLSGRQAGEPPPTLIDYLPPDALMSIDESHVTIPQIGGM